jgi:hypothetical protein
VSAVDRLNAIAREHRMLSMCLAELVKLSRNVTTYRSKGHIDALATFLDSYGAVFTANDAFLCDEQKAARERWMQRRDERQQKKAAKQERQRAKQAAKKKPKTFTINWASLIGDRPPDTSQ